ncbi:MAG: adenylate cyclase [Maribacter sp.]
MNTAARLQDAAKEYQIIIYKSCHEQVKEAFKCEPLGNVSMKNKAQPLVIFNVQE